MRSFDTETLDILNGVRGKKPRAAVRIEDLTGILQISQQTMISEEAVGTPTQDEYNALRKDVMKLNEALLVVAQALQARLL